MRSYSEYIECSCGGWARIVRAEDKQHRDRIVCAKCGRVTIDDNIPAGRRVEIRRARTMKYKVGDKVRVRRDLVLGKRYGRILCLLGHETASGKIFTIKNIRKQCDCYYRLNGSSFWWTEKMFEDVDEMLEEVDEMEKTGIAIVVDGNKTVASMNGKFGIAKCSPEDDFDIFTGARLAIDRLEEKCNPYSWLNYGVRYYVPSFIENNFYVSFTYRDDPTDINIKERGLVFKTKEEAIEATKKMLAVLKEDDDDD